MQKIILIDGNSIANRAFYALPLLNNSKGIYTNAVLGFTTMLLRLLEDEKPDYIACVFDAGKKTFRHDMYKEYKGRREKTPNELSSQFSLIKDVLAAFAIPIYELENYEADDILGTFAQQLKGQAIETMIVSGDKDLYQLVDAETKVYMTRRGITEIEMVDTAKIATDYQLEPLQMIDVKGLMGDNSDNIPGVPGVGEKTALKLIQDYHNIDGVYENLDKISGKKLKENLENYKDQAILSRDLATINREVPLTLDLSVALYGEYNREDLLAIFRDLEFKQLIDRLDLASDGVSESLAALDDEEVTYDLVEGTEDLAKVLANFDLNKDIAITWELAGLSYHDDEATALALSQDGRDIIIRPDRWGDPQLGDFLQKASLVCHDAKEVYYLAKRYKIKMRPPIYDIMLIYYLLQPTDNIKELADIAERRGLNLASEETIYGKKKKDFGQVEKGLRYQYLVSRNRLILKVKDDLLAEITEGQLEPLLFNIEMPLAYILAEMEMTGVRVEAPVLEELGQELDEKIEDLKGIIYGHAGGVFNINSTKQLGEILFEKLGIPPIKKTKTGYSTDAEVLEQLSSQHEIVEHIISYRQLAKLKSTYVDGLLKVIKPADGKIHTFYNQALTVTGRLSSTEPNLQNIPIRMEEGRKIRKAFVPSQVGWKLLAADYSQIELRILAHISNDPKLIEAFQADLDIHAKTASEVFGVGLDEVTSLMRRQAKAVNFGIIYGISDYGLAQNLKITRKEAQKFINVYLENFAAVKKYMEEIVIIARKQGYVETLLHRRRDLPDITSRNFNLRSFAERTALNMPIQGTAADIIKLAMVKIKEEMEARGLESRLLLQVHDELIFEVIESELDIMQDLVRTTMENCMKLSVPLKVDISIGDNWYDA